MLQGQSTQRPPPIRRLTQPLTMPISSPNQKRHLPRSAHLPVGDLLCQSPRGHLLPPLIQNNPLHPLRPLHQNPTLLRHGAAFQIVHLHRNQRPQPLGVMLHPHPRKLQPGLPNHKKMNPHNLKNSLLTNKMSSEDPGMNSRPSVLAGLQRVRLRRAWMAGASLKSSSSLSPTPRILPAQKSPRASPPCL